MSTYTLQMTPGAQNGQGKKPISSKGRSEIDILPHFYILGSNKTTSRGNGGTMYMGRTKGLL